MAAEWTYLLADLRTGYITAEVPLSGARPSKRLGAAGTMQGTWSVAQDWAGDPYALTRPARTAVYVLRDGNPLWGGILWTSSYAKRSGQISLGAADWWSYFDHRRVLPLLPGAPGLADIAQLDVTFTQLDQNEIARQLVAQAQAHTGGDLGLVLDAADSGTVRDRTWHGYELADVGAALKQLSEVDGGPDIMFDVGANLDSSGRPVRLMRIGNPRLGQQGAPFVFEWGANIIDYTWPSDGTRMTTRAFALGEGSERGAQIAVAERFEAYVDGWPLLESDVNYSTVVEAATLQSHADADLAAGKLPVVLPTLTVAGSGRNAAGEQVWPAIGEYAPGDDARVIIEDEFFRSGLDVTMRIVGIDFNPDDDGLETATLTMSPVTDNVA